ncbi:MAG: hypothetical protein H7834_13615, partial [Magnetococcus sp. YQC-9]
GGFCTGFPCPTESRAKMADSSIAQLGRVTQNNQKTVKRQPREMAGFYANALTDAHCHHTVAMGWAE